MANPHKGEVELKAGETVYVLRFSVDSICEVEEKAGKGFPALADGMGTLETITVSGVRLLLWGALRESHPDMSVKGAGELIPAFGGLAAVIPALATAIERAFPSEDSKDRP